MPNDNGLKNGKRCREKFRKYTQTAVSKVDKALLAGGYMIEADAKLNVTVDTGYLRMSLSTRLVKEGNKTVVEVGTNVEYAIYIELGTSPHMPPVEALEPWVKRVVLGGVETYDGEAKDIAFAIAKSISKWGTEAQPFLHPAYESNIRNIRVSIKQAIRESKGDAKK